MMIHHQLLLQPLQEPKLHIYNLLLQTVDFEFQSSLSAFCFILRRHGIERDRRFDIKSYISLMSKIQFTSERICCTINV